jgi:hypothetical protein
MYCKVSKFFAYLSMSYLLASIFYLIAIYTDIVKSPLKTALKDYPKLLLVKKESRKQRLYLFLLSLSLSFILLIIISPFKTLKNDNNVVNDVVNEVVNDSFDIHIKNF